MFEVNNKIIFVRGTYKNPIIEYVVVFVAESATNLEIIIHALGGIPYENNTIDGVRGWFKSLQALVRERDIFQFCRDDYRATSAKAKGTVRRTSLPCGFASFGYTREDEYRIGGNKADSGEVPGVKYSRQRLGDAWEDIRTKMYENEVHEDIIGEIEAYIKKLRTRKLDLETAVTEGLIPKYEAILKVTQIQENSKSTIIDKKFCK